MTKYRVITLLFFTFLVNGCASSGIKNQYGDEIDFSVSNLKSGNIRLDCEISCSGEYGANRAALRRLHDEELWGILPREVSRIGLQVDQAYYYLGRSAEGMGAFDAAKTYYSLALTTHKCGGLLDVCDGFKFPEDIYERRRIIAEKEKAAAEKAEAERVAAEQTTAEQTAAEQTTASYSQPHASKISSNANLIKLIEGSDVFYDSNTKELNHDLGKFDGYKEERWNSFQKSLIEKLPRENRDALTKFFLSSFSQYDDLEQVVIFKKFIDPDFFNEDFRDGAMTVTGVIGNDFFNSYIYLKYNDEEIGRISHVKIYSNNYKYEKDISFERSNNGFYTILSLSEGELFKVFDDLTKSTRSTIRFYGKNLYYDYELNNKDKEELRLSLMAVKDINDSF